MIKKFLDKIGSKIWSNEAPLDKSQYEKYICYQNIFRIRYIAFVLGIYVAVAIIKGRNDIEYMNSHKLTADFVIILISVIYFMLSTLFTEEIAQRKRVSNFLCIGFWTILILACTPFLESDLEAKGYLFYFVVICVMLTLIPVMKRRYMPVAFGMLAAYNLLLCAYTGASAEQVMDVIEFAVGFCLIDAAVIYRYISAISILSGSKYELQSSLEVVKSELELSRIKISVSQMQPHYLFNVLTAIQTIMKVEPEHAYDLIYDFTIHLRGLVKAMSSDAPIPFVDEIDNVMAYLKIEKMRLGDSLKIVRDTKDEDFVIAPLSIQPIAENAAQHGIGPKGKEGGTIIIRSYAEPGFHIVEVEDDGVGFDFEQTKKEYENSEHDSVGLGNLIFRLKSLMDADVVVSSVVGKGTKVTVKIPNPVK